MNFSWHCQCYSWALWGVLHGIHTEKPGRGEQCSRRHGHWGRDDWLTGKFIQSTVPHPGGESHHAGTLSGLDFLLGMQKLVERAWVEAAQHSKGTNAVWGWWERGAVCAHSRKASAARPILNWGGDLPIQSNRKRSDIPESKHTTPDALHHQRF